MCTVYLIQVKALVPKSTWSSSRPVMCLTVTLVACCLHVPIFPILFKLNQSYMILKSLSGDGIDIPWLVSFHGALS